MHQTSSKSYSVKTISVFEKQAKLLSKKYPSLKADLLALVAELQSTPTVGKSLGKNCYKIRLSISSKGKGKSGGARVITHIVIRDTTIYLLAIYDKSDKETLTDKELKELLSQIQ
jgi:hypothetical protein